MRTPQVFVRNSSRVIVAELGDWLSFGFVQRFNGVGTWQLEVSLSGQSGAPNPVVAHLTRTSGIVVWLDGETIFSGSVATEYTRTATTLRVAGYDDNILLDVPVLPTPTGPPYVDDYYVLTGQASAVMQQLVHAQVGFGARLDRRTAVTIPPDPGLGGTVTARGRWQSLIVLLRELAISEIAGGLQFEIKQTNTTGALQFLISESRDQRATAQFSTEGGTAQDFEDVYQHPPYNKVYVLLGDGLGSNRSVIEDEDAASIAEVGRRIETFIDARDVTDTGEGNQRAAEALAGAVSSRQVTITPFQVQSLEFGPSAEYYLGDLVTFVVNGEVFEEVIREVAIELSPERGLRITPLVGQGGASNDDVTTRQIAAVSNRLTNIERNFNVPDNSITPAMLTDALRPPIGKIEWLAGATVPGGYLAANGQAVSRTTYAALFAEIGTVWGAGNGTTTFNVPDLRNRSPIGAGATYPLGQLTGALTAALGAHNHAGAPHTHPGGHSHGAGTITYAHDHQVDIDHNHPAFSSGDRNNTTPGGAFRWDEPNVSSGTEDHHHSIDVPALGATNKTTTGAQNVSRSGSTDSDSNQGSFAASYTGSTGDSGGGSVSVLHPVAALTPVIYAGV